MDPPTRGHATSVKDTGYCTHWDYSSAYYGFEPPTRGQPPNKGQNLRSQSVLYSEAPLYYTMYNGTPSLY